LIASIWIDGVTEKTDAIDQDHNVRAIIYWGHAPNSQSRGLDMVEAMKKAGGSPKYTEYPKEGHGAWGPSAKEPELLPWLFAQQRP